MKFSNKRRFIVCMAAVGIIGAASTVALAEDTTFPPISGKCVGGTGTINEWCQCVSGQGGTLPIFGRILPPTSGSSKVSYKNDYVTAEVYNGSATPKTVTLATYKEYYKHENYNDVFDSNGHLVFLGQRVNDYDEIVVPPYTTVNVSAQMFTAEMPWCATQIDLYCGKAVNTIMGADRLAQRNLAWYHAHDTTSNPPGLTWCNPVCDLQMVGITGVAEGQKVEPGTKLNIGATTSGRTPYAVRFEVKGPNGVVSSNDQRRLPPYYYNGKNSSNGQPNGWDTTGLPEGDYTVTVSVFDTYRFENNQPCDVRTVNFRIVRAHCIKAGLMTVDYCGLNPPMTVDSKYGLPTSQMVNIPAWIETYSDDQCSKIEGGLPVKVSSFWSVVHPRIDSSDAREQAAAREMKCQNQMPADTCNAGQVNQDDQVRVSDANGKIDLNLEVWWPGIMQAYVDLVPDYPILSPGNPITVVSDQKLNALYQQYVIAHNLGALIVEDHYGMMIAGGSKGNFPLVNLGQPTDLVNSILWSPALYVYSNPNTVIGGPTYEVQHDPSAVDQDLHKKDPHYQHANGCVLTLVPDSTQ